LKSEILGTKLADAVVYSTVDDIDLEITGNTMPFTLNETIRQNTSEASGVMRFANSTHMKLTNVIGEFSNQSGYFITGLTSSANADINTLYPVLVVSDMDGTWAESNANYIVGQNSGSNAFCSLSNTIIYPELVRDSGEVLYIENREYIQRTSNTSETVRLLVKF
jgi:phosphatidate phosphatase PAH1